MTEAVRPTPVPGTATPADPDLTAVPGAAPTALPVGLRELSSAALAYLGDSVIELCVRERLVRGGLTTADHLNRAALEYVRAGAQARAMTRILPLLRDDEAAVYRRGRNSQHLNVPRGATLAEYRAATGMECLFAYLHLTAQTARLQAFFDAGYGTPQA